MRKRKKYYLLEKTLDIKINHLLALSFNIIFHFVSDILKGNH